MSTLSQRPKTVKRIYDATGYLNIDTLWHYGTFLTFCIGARGIGKTFNVLRYCIEHKINTIYVRRTKEEADIASGKETNVLDEICTFCGRTYERLDGTDIPTYLIYQNGLTEDERVSQGMSICFASLTTFHKVRSVGFHKYDCIVYDEFIPEKIARKIKHEADAFNNMIETVNRNRELTGKPPVKVFCLSNSNDIYNDILAHYNLIRHLIKMQKTGSEIFVDKQRSISIIYPLHSPISEKKKETALYKAMSDSSYADMALQNKFEDDLDKPYIKPQDLKEFKPIITVGEITIYDHKSEFKVYLTFHRSGSVRKLEVNGENMRQFRKTGIGKKAILAQFVESAYFENAKVFMLWKSYMNIT